MSEKGQAWGWGVGVGLINQIQCLAQDWIKGW